MDAFRLIAEQKIRQAMEEGEFDGLEGRGRPLDFSDDRHVPGGLRAVYRVLKNANCLPREVELRREIRCIEDLLPTIEDETELRGAVQAVNDKICALNMMTSRRRGGTVGGEKAQIYAEKLVERLRRSGHV